MAESLLAPRRLPARAPIANVPRECRPLCQTFAAAGSFGATYARALRRYLTPEVTVKIVGTPASGRFPRDRSEAAGSRQCGSHAAAAAGFRRPTASRTATRTYVCTDLACGAPVLSAADLRAALDANKVQPVPAAPQAGTDRIND